MSKYIIPISGILFSLLLLFIHKYAIDNYLYYYLPFLDLITHFLGGVCVALLTFYVFKKTKYIIPSVIIFGIAWEIFEVYFDITGWPISSVKYQIDTTIDMIMDILGGLAVWALIRFKK